MSSKKHKPVVILDTHRGIYFGYLVSVRENGNAVKLENARHCYYFRHAANDYGVYSLASSGPASGSKIGPRVNMIVRDVSKIIDCSPVATKKWESASWGG